MMLSAVGPGKLLNYSYQVFNAKTGEDKTARLDASVRLFRNGQAVFSGSPAPVSYAAKAAETLMTVKGKLNFTENIAPGDYSLQVVIKDKQAPEGAPSTASRYINFEVMK